LNDSAASTMASPGKTAIHGAWVMNCWAPASITPSDGVGGCTPSPRNDSTASSMIARGIAMVACTIRALSALGRMWPARIAGPEAPLATAASTKSSSRRLMVSPRMTRRGRGISLTAMAMVALSSDGPRIAARPTASTRKGKASSVSVSRDTTGSTRG
jgi:hypothetical protein